MRTWTYLLAAVFGLAAPALGQEWECRPLESPKPGSGDQFGCAVAIDGRSVAISANRDDDEARGIPDAGSVTLFEGSGEPKTIFAGDAASGDHFGIALALAGTTLVVGAPGVDLPSAPDAGAVYVLRRTGAGWVEERPRLTAGESARRGAAFGEAVALRADGILIAVGAPSDSGPASLSGAVYLFARIADGWLRSRLEARPGAFDGFGSSVAVEGDTLAVGAPFADGSAGGSQGEVWIFRRRGSDWSLLRRITAGSFARAGAQFGSAVSLSGDTLAVAATRDDPDGRTDAGAVYLFSSDGATFLQRLIPSGLRAGEQFGSAVSLDGDRLLVGARLDDRGEGAAYLFERTEGRWTEAPDGLGTPGGELGQAVAIQGDRAVLGAYLEGRAELCGPREEERPDLTCSIQGPATVAAGGQATYSVTVTNQGEAAATGVELGDLTPSGLSLAGTGPPCGGRLPCLLGTLDPGDSTKINVTFQVPPGCSLQAPFRPEASVRGNEPEPDATNNTCTPKRSTRILPPTGCGNRCPDPFRKPGDPPADLPPGIWGIVEGPAEAVEGSTIEYRILLANGGPGPQPDIEGPELEHLLPFGLELLAYVADSGQLRAPVVSGDPTTTLFWDGNIPLCGIVTIEVKALVLPGAASPEVCLQGLIRDGETVRLTGLRGSLDPGKLCVRIVSQPS